MKSWLRTVLYFIAVIIITAGVTAGIMTNAANAKKGDEVILTAEEYSKLSDLTVFNEAIETITDKYYYDPPTREELIESGLRGMVDSLGDQYSRYFTADEYERRISSMSGKYSGFGIVASQYSENGVSVLIVYPDSPAEAAGIIPGDVISSVDGISVTDISFDELSAYLSKPEGESAEFVILRDGKKLDFSLQSAQIITNHVDHKMFNHRTGYITISMFSGNCAEEFREAIDDLIERGMECLVIDLRNNPGGSFADALSIADTLLPECTITSVKGRLGDYEHFTSNKKGIKLPMAVIVNGNTASASEILAAAVQESGAGIVVGNRTFGKGIIQTSYNLQANGGWIMLTDKGYYTPQGNSIHGTGIEPDIEVNLPSEIASLPISQINQDDDAQLWAALDYVRGAVSESDN